MGTWAMVPTVVLIPAPFLGVLDQEMAAAEQNNPRAVELWDTDRARANGWTREAVLSGLLLAQYLNALQPGAVKL